MIQTRISTRNSSAASVIATYKAQGFAGAEGAVGAIAAKGVPHRRQTRVFEGFGAWLAAGLTAMRDAGARIALLAGSGSSIFAVFDSADARDAADTQVGTLGLRTWRAETIASQHLP